MVLISKARTLGVIGAGYIGLNVIKIAKGFDMKVLAFDTHRERMIAEVLGFEYASLDVLLEKSDIVSLNLPHNEHTHHLINRETIGKMKPGAILINTARGGIVDTEALVDALDSGHLA
ncbi:hydroxyacid dehydrogenase, partial [bacterium]|nr:hydroxyacid dehydrogenase [bacterium]